MPLIFQMSYLLVPKNWDLSQILFGQKWPKTAIVHRKRPKGRPEGSSRQDRAVAAVAASGQAGGNLEGLSRQLGSCCQLQAAVMAAALPRNATCARHEGHIRPHTRRTEACSRQASRARGVPLPPPLTAAASVAAACWLLCLENFFPQLSGPSKQKWKQADLGNVLRMSTRQEV